jgi:LPXTG-site transpeptidase (sortase) family protein
VSIPAVNLFAKLQPLHVDAKGRLVPPDHGIAGWYAAGPEPGEQGPAVIAGHLDSKVGPDTFFRLGQVRPGQRIRVGLTDGTKLAFRVTEIKQFSKDNFPTKRVYGATNKPELRMITCAGDYDHAAGHYKDNLVVFADLTTGSWRSRGLLQVATSADVATCFMYRPRRGQFVHRSFSGQRQPDERLARSTIPCDVVVLLTRPFVVGPLRGAGQQVPHLQHHRSHCERPRARS